MIINSASSRHAVYIADLLAVHYLVITEITRFYLFGLALDGSIKHCFETWDEEFPHVPVPAYHVLRFSSRVNS